jgi:NtrC-family two-component system response regulator AlgB
MLHSYAWPGNVRELRNAMERALILWPAGTLEPEAFPDHLRASTGSAVALGAHCPLETIEREHILRVLATTPTLEEASTILGIDASTLYRKRKRYEGS